MEFEKAKDIQKALTHIVSKLDLKYVDASKIVCFRSTGSKSRARARIWSFPRIWQMALDIKPHYIIEVVSGNFDHLPSDDQKRVLIHELLHIPKNFSGALLPHKNRSGRIDRRSVEKLFKLYKNNLR